jgi:hypothetical protein
MRKAQRYVLREKNRKSKDRKERSEFSDEQKEILDVASFCKYDDVAVVEKLPQTESILLAVVLSSIISRARKT